MYKLRGIEKSYKKRGMSRIALAHVDLDLPNTGLFAVVGESGSGKSTLLHLLSGLVVPDKGTIEINGNDVSTLSDSARCGFTARCVGFMFQENELVAHATLLENMQATLTLAGFPKREVIEKANSALSDAGLSELQHCLPQQLSKHQLRTFSLARALCKDANVILLDEPEIGLTEIEREHLIHTITCASVNSLVVVATRDSHFAEALNAHVITIQDGVINHAINATTAFRADASCAATPDTDTARTVAPCANACCTTVNPIAPSKPRAVRVPFTSQLDFVRASLRNRSGRSFVLGLSAMLGIIALAFVLTISQGITTYLNTNNRDNLSQQPLQINTLAYNTEELTNALAGSSSTQLSASELITKTLRSAKNNDLKSLKSHIEANKNAFSECTDLIDYDYGITPQVFASDTSAGTISLRTSTISDLSSSYTASFTSPAGFTTMSRLDAKAENYTSQYDVVQGRWPEKYNELVLVLPSDRTVPGLEITSNSVEAKLQRLNDTITLFKTGKLAEDNTVESFTFSLQDYMDLDLKLVSVAECYTRSEDGTSWQNNSSDEDFMKTIIANSEDLKIVGVVAPSEHISSETLSSGLWYLPSLETYIAQRASETDVVKAQIANPDVDVFTGIRFDSHGRTFDDVVNSISSSMNAAFSSIAKQLSAALEQTFADIENELNKFAQDEGFELNFTDNNDTSSAEFDDDSITLNWEDIFGTIPNDNKIIVDVNEDAIDEALLNVFTEYLTEALLEGKTPTCEDLVNYLARQEVNEKLSEEINSAFTTIELDEETEERLNAFVDEYVLPCLIDYIEEEYTAYIAYIETQLKADTYEPFKQLQETLDKLNSDDVFAVLGIDTALNDFFKEFDLSGTYDVLNNLFALDEASEEEADAAADESETSASSGSLDPRTKKFLDLMVKMATTTQNTYSLNMKALGYSDFSTPSTIRFYTPNYEDRTTLNSLINNYNTSVSASNDSSKHIDYYDLVDTVTHISMSIVDVASFISVVLLLFMGIATTLTIGAITFFSSRDRWRETSIMRVLGATRCTVFVLLILEGAVIGLLSAALGTGITALVSMSINASTQASAGFSLMLFEPWHVALLLALGVIAMIVGYLIPAIAISRKDAVSVLRAR